MVQTKSDLQHGGDSAIIERADGYQREAANIETLEKIVPQVDDHPTLNSAVVKLYLLHGYDDAHTVELL